MVGCGCAGLNFFLSFHFFFFSVVASTEDDEKSSSSIGVDGDSRSIHNSAAAQ